MSIAFIASAIHKDSLSNRLNDQRKEGQFCDVLLKGLICGERPSPPFLTDVPQEIELVMPGIEADPGAGSDTGGGLEAVMDLLDYIYTGKIELKEDSVDLVVQLAEVFMLDGLSSLIQTYMNDSANNKPAKQLPVSPPTTKSTGSVSKSPLASTRQLLMLQQRRRQQRRVFARKTVQLTNRRAPTNATINNSRSNNTTTTRVANAAPNSVFEPEVRVLRSRKRPAVTLVDHISGEEEEDHEEEEEEELSDNIVNHTTNNREAKRGGGGSGANNDRKYNFHCKLCDFVSADSAAVRQHKTIHPGRSYKCLSCAFTTAQSTKLIQHLLASDDHLHDTAECSVCGEQLADRAALRDHLERHDDRHKLLACERCEYRCRTPAQLSVHAATHNVDDSALIADRPYACEVCGRGFKSKYNMQTHLQTHERERSLACELCPYTTGTKTSLRAHERSAHGTSTGVGGGVGTAANLFQCTHDGCEYQVSTRHDLQVHLLKHVDPQPYHCTVCGQKYAQKNSLKRHVKIHNLDEYLLRCGECEFTTTRSDKMRNHMNKLHPDSEPLDRDDDENDLVDDDEMEEGEGEGDEEEDDEN